MWIECKKCNKKKRTEDFPKSLTKKNGLGSWCKKCKRVNNRETDRLYQKRRRELNPSYKTKEYKDYCRRFPNKVTAHRLLNIAIKKGIIKRSPCEKCLNKRTHAHHEDYSKPYDVMFLCPIHHKEIHK